ncbi:alkaline phosphatase family protein [Paraburkholderia sp. CNPSo 3274]|uniref:alkaline phosphatase family protein n=1 Tax=Paraburkholderia sp. CNPSo 3274 TaxID=2940932 RepID=UPI002816614F|nr:alkaline phosphatase family protein [Paraburkholderia sp. CNPSo 3274]
MDIRLLRSSVFTKGSCIRSSILFKRTPRCGHPLRSLSQPTREAVTTIPATFNPDFFGDGPRIPLIVVSPYSRGGRVVHDYSDHVSLVKFIERNWSLGRITSRSRDNLPNPVQFPSSPYVPTNAPAIGDLFSAFRFQPVKQSGADNGNEGAAGMFPF